MLCPAQILYRRFFKVGEAIILILLIVPLFTAAGVVYPRNRFMTVAVSALIAGFFLTSMYLYGVSRRKLSTPLPARQYKRRSAFIITLFLFVIAYNVYTWPYAPLKSEGGVYTDKYGNVYTRQQYLRYQKSDVALNGAGGAFALWTLISFPAYCRREGRA